ncbi:MAG: hypothetical protein IPO72_00535 [Saprospiraceae bacterium]|nr:hypothetical protein [Candidatus Vicinibacter affinis]
MNRDYQKLNADTSQVVSAFKNKIAKVGFKFVLAGIDPEGNCTNGIVRHYSSKNFWNADSLQDFTFTWPPERYLNFYIVKSINLAPAYTFLPGIGIPNHADAVVCESWLVGSIGTATPANSRVLTHEVGHWFGLPHIWGVSNAPGVACGDDFVDDTPVTKGFVSCNINNAAVCDPNFEENVQNYMDYAPCKLMFTNGQSDYMHETIELGLNKRDQLVSMTNLNSTGVLGNPPCRNKADFVASYTAVCKGESIAFSNQSQTGADSVQLTWFIEGGIPSVASDPVIEIRFPDTGIFEIKLLVTSTQTIDSISKFIRVTDGEKGLPAPQMYSFEDGRLPDEFKTYNFESSGIQWEVLKTTGAVNTQSCVFLNHANGINSDHRSYLETPYYDLSKNNKPSMSFYYSYAKKYPNQADSFRLEYTLDCGKSWNIFQGLHSTQIMSNLTGGIVASAFYPKTSKDWRKLNLTNSFEQIFKNQPSVKFRFYFKSDPRANGSNNIFIDEINISDESITGVTNNKDEPAIQIYPNPSNSLVIIDIKSDDLGESEIEIGNLTNFSTEIIKPVYTYEGKTRFILNTMGHMQPGIYFLRIKKEGYTEIIRKIVLLEK